MRHLLQIATLQGALRRRLKRVEMKITNPEKN